MSVAMVIAVLVGGSNTIQLTEPPVSTLICELHIWPSDGLTSVRQRAFESNRNQGLIPELVRMHQQDIAEKADARTARAIAASENPLSAGRQVPVLQGLAAAELLGLPDHRVIIHADPLDSRTIRTTKHRYARSDSPCYAELVIAETVYTRAYARGQTLRTFLRFRVFDNAVAPERAFATWTETKLDLFSLAPLRADAPALEELASALRSNVVRFAEFLKASRPPPATTKGKE